MSFLMLNVLLTEILSMEDCEIMEKVVVNPALIGIMMCFVAFVVSYGFYPLVLRMARVWKIYDNPGERKLQKQPVPVFGGMVVFVSICAASLVASTIFFDAKMLWILPTMAVLFVVGVADDKFSLSPYFRLFFEIGVVSAMVFVNGNYIDNLNGIWGVWTVNDWIAIPFSIFAGVGIINAINLIDGVDGYSSGYGMMVFLMMSAVFYLSDIVNLSVLSLICVGALLPFFLHNVFGAKTKMFIGDGGALMIGMLITIFCFSILKQQSFCFETLLVKHNVGLIPMTLSFLSIAVFDTLRVMLCRIIRGVSPFHADKSHMHHLFIGLGFSHFGTTFTLLTLNSLIVLFWLLSCLCGASVEWQLYIVVFFSLFNTFGIYSIACRSQRVNGLLCRWLRTMGKRTKRWEENAFWYWMNKLVDGDLFEEGKV